MRIFHLSDLHIGIRLYNYDLREEQEYIFNEIILRNPKKINIYPLFYIFLLTKEQMFDTI